jgi:HEAT repeat protein
VKRRLSVIVALATLSVTTAAAGSPPEEREVAVSSWAASRSLLDHFGVEVARRLLRGGDADVSAADETLRGIDRAVGLGTEDGVSLLVHLLGDRHGLARSDARVLLAATRALAPFAAQRAVARTLTEAVLNAGTTKPDQREEARSIPFDGDRAGRVDLARRTAALALARVRDAHATEVLIAAARGGGTGQRVARAALLAFPPVATTAPVVLTPNALRLSIDLVDLRGEDTTLEASRSLDAAVRALALRGAGVLGDARALPRAEEAKHDGDALVREAATAALVDLGAPDAAGAVRALIEDDATAGDGIALSERVMSEEVVGALAARVRVSSDGSLRSSAIVALGRQDGASALAALRELMTDPVLAGDAGEAVARSRDPGAWQVISDTLARSPSRRLGARMAALRGRVSGGVPVSVLASLRSLSRAPDPANRAAGVSALVLLGSDSPADGLADVDPRVRQAAAMACDPADPPCARALLRQLVREGDPLTRRVLMAGLAAEGEPVTVTTTVLRAHARDGGIDAPISTLALARRGADEDRDVVLHALASGDPLVRAHAARGLASSTQAWAAERLANAYELEVDIGARHAIVDALSTRVTDDAIPSRARALDRAARLDPDAAIRTVAERALRGLPPPRPSSRPDAVWLRVMDATGAPPGAQTSATLLRADGLAVPVVFDGDGYALVPAPTGPARLSLAPQVRAYEVEPHGD